MDNLNKIPVCIQILNDIEVKGEKNLNNLLAAIQILKQISTPAFPEEGQKNE